MQNKYFFTKMQQFISELFWAFAGKPFEIYTTNVMEDKIRCEVEKLYPDFYLNARIVGREIRISREFYKEYAIAMMFLPCMFQVKEYYFYDLYIDNVPVGRISFKRNLDPCNYGYIVTVDPFKWCEHVRNAFNPVEEIVTDSTENLENEQTKIAMNCEKSQHYQKFCQYRDMPYGTQGREPEKRSIRRLADAMGMKSKSSIEKLSTQWNWVERAAAYDVYMTELERFKNEQEIKKMHDLHAKLGVQLLNKATRGLIALPDNELSAQDIARLADVGVKIERMSRGDSAESIAVSAKATVEHSGGLELSGSIPDMSDLSDEELENLEQILGKLHK